jgi:hypothetical protein
MHDAGFGGHIVNCDISGVCIDLMTKRMPPKAPVRDGSKPQQIDYLQLDACAKDFAGQLSEGLGQTGQANEHFSVIITKATVDAVLCKKDGIRDVEILFENAYSALREDGIFVIICLQENTKILCDTIKAAEKWEVELCEIGLYHTGKKYSYTGNSAHAKYCSKEAEDFSQWRFIMLILSKKGHSHNTENGMLRLVQRKNRPQKKRTLLPIAYIIKSLFWA